MKTTVLAIVSAFVIVFTTAPTYAQSRTDTRRDYEERTSQDSRPIRRSSDVQRQDVRANQDEQERPRRDERDYDDRYYDDEDAPPRQSTRPRRASSRDRDDRYDREEEPNDLRYGIGIGLTASHVVIPKTWDTNEPSGSLGSLPVIQGRLVMNDKHVIFAELGYESQSISIAKFSDDVGVFAIGAGYEGRVIQKENFSFHWYGGLRYTSGSSTESAGAGVGGGGDEEFDEFADEGFDDFEEDPAPAAAAAATSVDVTATAMTLRAGLGFEYYLPSTEKSISLLGSVGPSYTSGTLTYDDSKTKFETDVTRLRLIDNALVTLNYYF